ncbi:hypothetical protein FACS1894166_05540 [Bacilli bacterium]|nr:hypothetical protein FACS1894166_05540 [Bacilli bacterium]
MALSHLSPLYTSVKEITTTTTTTPYENLKEAKPCLNTLLYGDKHYNGGNYVVIIGTDNQSINSENLNTFIFGTNDESKRSDKIVPQDAPVIQASQKIEEYFKGFNYSNSGAFAVDTYIEADRVSDADYGRDDNMQNPTIKEGEFLTPFDKFTKGDYLKNDSNKKYKEGKYIREDEDAKQYRKLAKTLTKLFPEVDLSNSKSVALQ